MSRPRFVRIRRNTVRPGSPGVHWIPQRNTRVTRMLQFVQCCWDAATWDLCVFCEISMRLVASRRGHKLPKYFKSEWPKAKKINCLASDQAGCVPGQCSKVCVCRSCACVVRYSWILLGVTAVTSIQRIWMHLGWSTSTWAIYIYINYLDTFTPESVYILNPNVKCSVNPDGPVPQDVWCTGWRRARCMYQFSGRGRPARRKCRQGPGFGRTQEKRVKLWSVCVCVCVCVQPGITGLHCLKLEQDPR